MQTIQIFVHPLSAKILKKEYGSEAPINLRKNDLIFDLLHAVRAQRAGIKKRSIEWLCEPLLIQVYEDLARLIKKHNSNVGISLFDYHRKMLFEYVEAQEEGGVQINTAIMNFYKKFGIAEDDYAFETAYRKYRIFKKNRKKTNIFGTKKERGETQIAVAHLRLCDTSIIQRASVVAQSLYPESKVFKKHLTWYMLYKIGRYSVRAVAAKTGGKRNTVHNAIQSVSNRMLTDGNLRIAVHN